MNIDKEIHLTEAKEALVMAQKMLSRFESSDQVTPTEMSRVLDAANQAMQAGQQLHQLAGILQVELRQPSCK